MKPSSGLLPRKRRSLFRRLAGVGTVVACAVTTLVCCAHYDGASGTYDGPVWAPAAGQSRNLDYIEGIVGGIAIIYEMGRVSAGGKTPQILGVCKVKVKRGLASGSNRERCQETFVLFKRLGDGHESKVWTDAAGEFAFTINPGEAYDVVAVNERLRTRSKDIRISRPGIINLQIELETVEAQPVSAASSSTASSDGDPAPGVPSKAPLSDFGLKPGK